MSATSCEILPLYILGFKFLLLTIYHPFWGMNNQQHSCAIDAITDICDYSATNFP